MSTTALPVIALYGQAAIGKTSLVMDSWNGRQVESPENRPLFEIELPSGRKVLVEEAINGEITNKSLFGVVMADISDPETVQAAKEILDKLDTEESITILNKVDLGLGYENLGLLGKHVQQSEVFLTSTFSNHGTSYVLKAIENALENFE